MQKRIEDCKVLSEYGLAHYRHNERSYGNTFLAVERGGKPDLMICHMFVWDFEELLLVPVETVELGKNSLGWEEDFDLLHEVLQKNYINSHRYALGDVEIAENGDFDYAGEEYYNDLNSEMA